MALHSSQEQANYTYAQDLGGLPLLSASFKHQSFSRHVHEGYCIGVIDQGAQRFFRSGANHIASQDCIILVNPDQVHDGHSASKSGWKYRAIYPLPHLLESALAELSVQNMGTALFCEPVVSDQLLANQLRGLFNLIQYSDNLLERETTFLSVISRLLLKHAKQPYKLEKLGKEPKAVKIVKEYLDAHFVDNISTRELADLAGLNPYYLTRLFQSSVGLPPHAYQIQKRLNCAKSLLLAGQAALDTALFCGFTDQSHLHRHFKKYLGVGPGAFQRSNKLNLRGPTIG